ncbi:MAG: hypothetical protein K6C33_10795 [Desulfovibrio sp.]|jgi:hypothetical protein|nr:hypothetical protein [Desulfovibrio sp.]
MDLEHFAQAPDLEQERRLVNEESLALCEAAQAVLDEDAELARVLHGLFYGEDEQDFMALSGEHPFEVASGLVGYWLWVLASAGLNTKASKRETPLEILRRRNEPVLQGPLRDVVEEACVSRLSLYEVQAVEGPRIQILDLLAKGAEPVWVDTYPSQVFFVPWDIMGLRILGIGRSFRASHSVHFFSREQGLALARILRIAMRKNARLAHPLPWVLLVDQPIVRAWFDNILNRDMPEDPQPEYDMALLASEGGEELLKQRMLAWTGEANELLDGRTPAKAARMARERVKVVNMLKSFEHQEALRVDEMGGEPFSFRFLWEKLGLNPGMPSL